MADSAQSETELDRYKSEEVTFAPIATSAVHDGAPLQAQRSNGSKSMKSIERRWSLNDGTSIVGNDQAGGDQDTEYTVGWDENDPLNPRNMSKGRRWLIVIIVSLGSLCV